MLDRERMKEYQRERRAKLKGVGVIKPNSVTKDVTVVSLAVMDNDEKVLLRGEIAALKLEIKKLTAQNALLESKLKAYGSPSHFVDEKKKDSPYKFGPEWQRRTEPLRSLS